MHFNQFRIFRYFSQAFLAATVGWIPQSLS